MRRIAFVTDSGSITRILAYLGEPPQAPYIAPATRVGAFPPVPADRRTSTGAGALASGYWTPSPRLTLFEPPPTTGRPD